MTNDTEREKLSAEVHKCYCRSYERRYGKPYWTNGDYSKLDEPTKDYDREMADFIIADRKRIVEPLVNLVLDNGGSSYEELCQGIEETLKNAGL